jgi:hypothetical protein
LSAPHQRQVVIYHILFVVSTPNFTFYAGK